MRETGCKQKAYEHIRRQIVSGELMPGDVVSEKELIEQLGISRTPIREAIQRLAEENLLVVMPSRGTIVSYISVDDVGQIYKARKLIEPYLAREAVGHADPERLKQFREVFENQTKRGWQENDWDSEFHLYLAECSGNRFLHKTMQELMTQSMRIRVLSSEKKQQRFELSRAEHLALIDAILAGDADRAEQEVLNHLIRSEDGYRDFYENQVYFSL